MQVLVLAKSLVSASQLDSEDVGVPGTYCVQIDDKIDPAYIANAALDGLHNHVAIGVLDDFEFSAHEFETGREIDQDADAESYEHGSSCRAVDKISDGLDPLCVRATAPKADSPGI
jgi:hypothetical protein